MEFTYVCKSCMVDNYESWIDTICPLMPFDCTEYEVSARGSCFHLIIGEHQYSRYIYIPNTVLDPEIKEKVLNQSIFLYTCPNCGETFRLNYPTLYHQMEDLIMIYLVPESEVEKTYEMFHGENALADFRTEKYLNRIVTSANQLIEKIQIFDAGKDDRIIELVKLLATDSILKNDPDIEFDELRFAVDNDGTNILVIINRGEITGAVNIDNMYEFASSYCNDFKDLRDDEDIVINREWILNKLAEAQNE